MPRSPLPLWTRDELLLALWTAVDLVHPDPSGPAIDIDRLSRILRYSHGPLASAEPRLRNPHGVARKVGLFLDLLHGRARHPSPLERSVWQAFQATPDALARQAQLALQRLTTRPQTPSRGPPPSFGHYLVERHDGSSLVYIATLEGVRLESGTTLIKVGRTNCALRRVKELNFGFPQTLGIRWRMVRTWTFADAEAAHRAEQSILLSEAELGHSDGCEFVLVAPLQLEAFLARCERTISITRACGQRTLSPAKRRRRSGRRVRRRKADRRPSRPSPRSLRRSR